MNPRNCSLRVLLLALLALVTAIAMPMASAREATSASGGRLVIRHSPALGLNVVVGVMIDGKRAGAFTKGHTFERSLSPGRHIISAFYNGREWQAWRTTVEVHSGQTYSYFAKYRYDKLVLDRATIAR